MLLVLAHIELRIKHVLTIFPDEDSPLVHQLEPHLLCLLPRHEIHKVYNEVQQLGGEKSQSVATFLCQSKQLLKPPIPALRRYSSRRRPWALKLRVD